MNTIGVAYYADQTQGLVDLQGMLKRSWSAAEAIGRIRRLSMRPAAIERRARQLFAERCCRKQIYRIELRKMDGTYVETIFEAMLVPANS